MTTSEGTPLVDRSKPKVKIRADHRASRLWVASWPHSANESSHMLSFVIFSAIAILSIAFHCFTATTNASVLPSKLDARSNGSEEAKEGLTSLAFGSRANSAATSELSFEYLDLELIPSAQLCKLEYRNQVNSVSFASNQIKYVNSSAFVCVGLRLKILNLRNNKIESISDEAFKGLVQLQVLVLDGNHLKVLPWRQLTAAYLPALRHLSLAYNRLTSINASETLVNPSLISLNLRGNPLEQIHRQSLSGLAKLKTLTLSQVDLKTSQLARFDGLPELSFVHLDRLGQNLSSLDGQFCETSRKLATLSLKSNQLEMVPQLTSCHGLLSLDLSYNRIHGTLAANFSQLSNLIDLYLGHNQLDYLNENAFEGLQKLQVLDLNSNKIKTIHSNAFIPIRATLYELNIANNIQLSLLTSNGLDQLISLKSYGNNQLRKLPAELPSARQLVLTFAYHCCDYYNDHDQYQNYGSFQAKPASSEQLHKHFRLVPDDEDELGLVGDKSARIGSFGSTETDRNSHDKRLDAIHQDTSKLVASNRKHDDQLDSSPLAVSRWSNLILSKLAQLWPPIFHSAGQVDSDQQQQQQSGQGPRLVPVRKSGDRPDETVASSGNMSELVLWRPRGTIAASASADVVATAREAIAADKQQSGSVDDDDHFRALNLQQHNSRQREERHRARPEAVGGARPQARHRRRPRRAGQFAARESAPVIDELVRQAGKIRSAHLHDDATGQPIRQAQPEDDDGDSHYDVLLAKLVAVEPSDDQPTADCNDSSAPAQEETLEQRAELVALALANELSSRYSTINNNNHKRGPTKRAASDELSDDDTAQQRRRQSLLTERSRGQPTTSGQSRARVQCLPRPDAFQPCRDLFDSIWLRASIWLVFLLAFAGNILVIVVLSSVKPSSSTSALTSIMWFNAAQSKRHIDVPRFLVINLAVADLLMAVYLGLLAFTDLSTLGEFRIHAIKWQYSTGCQLAGFLAVLSSELSVFILAIITLERNYAITNAVHLNRRLSLQKAMVIMFFGYLYALTMAILPLNGINDYRKFSICLPLDFDPNNWRSSSSLYLILLISINTLSFVLLISCYLRMYCAIRGSQAWSTNDLKIAKRMSILVVTDFFCWSPIIFVATLALFGYYLVGTNGLKVLIIFVLPLNSVANPFLYAITTKKFKRDLATLKKRLKVQQALDGMARALISLAPLWRGCSGQQDSTAWTIKADRGTTAAGGLNGATSTEQVYCRANAASRAKRLKKANSPIDCRLVIDGKQRAGRAKSATRGSGNKQELLLVNQSGRSVLANGQTSRMGGGGGGGGGPPQSRSIQFRSTAVDLPDEQVCAGDNLVGATKQDTLQEQQQQAASRIVVTHCATCHSQLLVRSNLIATESLELDATCSPGRVNVIENSCDSSLKQTAPYLTPSRQSITRPRIVLDSVEPVLDVALAPLKLVDVTNSGHLLTTHTNCGGLLGNGHESSASDCRLSQSSLGAPQPGCRQLSASDTMDHHRCQAQVGDQQQKRASSADKPKQRPGQLLSLIVSHAEASRHASLDARHFQVVVNQQPMVSSCRTVVTGDQNGCCKTKPYGNLLNCGLTDLGVPSNRSVSACGYSWPVADLAAHDHCGNNNQNNNHRYYLTAAAPRTCCSCSCDMMQVGQGGRDAKLLQDAGVHRVGGAKPIAASCQQVRPLSRGRTRSISRFVFEPLAKAWSSLQLSFQSNPVSTATTTTLAANSPSAATTVQPHKASNIATSISTKASQRVKLMDESKIGSAAAFDNKLGDCDDEFDSESTERDGLLVDLHESSIIEDVLQMSSPKRRQWLKGRRMSRSCDIIVECSTTTSTAEPTSSSFYDQNDDQRILLATINQLNSRGRKNRKQTSLERQDDDINQQVSTGSRRMNCTRCRSWSPALLEKLEDCMHQIRHRIPKFSNKKHDQNNQLEIGIEQTQNLASYNICQDGGEQSAVACSSEKQPSQSSASSSSSQSCSSSLNLSDPVDNEEDEFNEDGLAEWTKSMQKKAAPSFYSKSVSHGHRLRQQLSGNSDTISVRTVGTTLTSVSFDSSSNIPTTVSGSMENAVQQTVSSSLLPSTKNENDGTTDNQS